MEEAISIVAEVGFPIAISLVAGVFIFVAVNHILNGILDQLVSSCSAGQVRRLCLSKLLYSKKRIWLLDEPTSTVDANTSNSLSTLINRHCSIGGIAIIATHEELSLSQSKDIFLSPPKDTKVSNRKNGDPFLKGKWQ